MAKYDYIGWDAWSKRLIAVSFMAPIFMFFMYLIFSLLSKNLFGSLIKVQKDWIQTILGVIVPGMLILILLLQAVKFAKKGSGAMGEMVMKGAKMAGGLALGAAAGGAGLALSGGLGSLSSRIARGKGLNEAAKKDGLGGMAARMALGTAKYGSKASFDVRGMPGVGALAKMGGVDIGKAKEGGYTKRRADNVKKRQERAKDLEVGEDEHLKQELNNTEMNLQRLLFANAKQLQTLDKTIEKKRQEVLDMKNTYGDGSTEHKQAQTDFKNAREKKKALVNAEVYAGDKDAKGAIITGTNKDYTGEVAGPDYIDASGISHKRTINNMENIETRDRKQAIEAENRERKVAYAERKVKYGMNDIRTDREAAHKIITEVKLDSGTKT